MCWIMPAGGKGVAALPGQSSESEPLVTRLLRDGLQEFLSLLFFISYLISCVSYIHISYFKEYKLNEPKGQSAGIEIVISMLMFM